MTVYFRSLFIYFSKTLRAPNDFRTLSASDKINKKFLKKARKKKKKKGKQDKERKIYIKKVCSEILIKGSSKLARKFP